MADLSSHLDAFQALAFYFDENDAPESRERSIEHIHRYVEQNVAQLLERNPERLMSILYRIDVPEPAVHKAFQTAPPGQLASVLADLIVRRQLEKIETRRKYGQRPGNAQSG